MVFSSHLFVFYFLPAALALYYIMPRRAKHLCLTLLSYVFYGWANPLFVVLMFTTTLIDYIAGLVIAQRLNLSSGAPIALLPVGGPRTRAQKLALTVSICANLTLLGFFKYFNFGIENYNALMSALGLGAMQWDTFFRVTLPLGISFYTFQLLSYIFDLYRGKIQPERNLLSFAAYAAMFPQILSGPIVRYCAISDELKERKQTLPDFAAGAQRFVLGLGKKVLFANALAEITAAYSAGAEASVLFAWLNLAAYTLRIYYDFSGYSDMAIGLARMMGFHFPENFDYPYIAKSVTEFWRRWHMTLSAWFRDYVYIPLGGNRAGVLKHVRNILAVWLLTGLWHGASWNFLLWGLYFALFLLLEKYVYGRFLEKLPAVFRHASTMLVVLISFCLFDAPGLAEAASRAGSLFGAGGIPLFGARSVYCLKSYLVLILLAGAGATPLPKRLVERLQAKLAASGNPALGYFYAILCPVALAALLFVSTAYIIDGSFSPFIYFRF